MRNLTVGMLNARTEIRDRFTKSENLSFDEPTFRSRRLTKGSEKVYFINASTGLITTLTILQSGQLDGQEYSLGQIRVTTSSHVAEI